MAFPFEILTVAETAQLFQRAIAAFEGLADDPDLEHAHSEVTRRTTLLHHALQLAILQAERHGHASLAPLLVQAVGHQSTDDASSPEPASAASALTAIVARTKAPTSALLSLASDGDPTVRQAVAAGLRVEHPASRAVLEELRADVAPAVRKVAREKLGVAGVAWWVGAFSRDPTERLARPEGRKLTRALRTIVKVVDDEPHRAAADDAEFLAAVDALPPPLLQELCRRVASGPWTAFDAPLILRALEAEGGGETAVALLGAWGQRAQDLFEYRVTQAWKPLSPRARSTVAWAFVRSAVAHGSEAEHMEWYAFEAAIAAALLPDEDVPRLLDLLLEHVDDADDPDDEEGGAGYWHVLAAKLGALRSPPTELLARAAKARAEGFAGAHAPLRNVYDDLLARGPHALVRPLLEAALRSEHERDRRWAIPLLVGAHYRPKTDGPLARFIARLAKDPRNRDGLLDDQIRDQTLPFARAELRAGRLDARAALSVFLAIHSLWRCPDMERLRPGRDADEGLPAKRAKEARQRTRKRATLDPLLGPEGLRGPITAADWRGLRAAIAATSDEEIPWILLPWRRSTTGPLKEDRPAFERAWRCAQTIEHGAASGVVSAIAAQPSAERLTILRAIAIDERYSFNCVPARRLHAQISARLGLPPTPLEATASASADGNEDAATTRASADDNDWLDP